MAESTSSWGAQLKSAGGQLLTAPARANPVPIISNAIPSSVKESKPGQLVQDAYSAITFDWDEGSQGHLLAKVPAIHQAAKENPDLRDELFKLMTRSSFAAGETVMSRGDPGYEMFFIMQGEVGIHLDTSAPAVATLGAGDICGEGALISDEPRAAHVLAVEDTEVLVLTKGDLDELLPRYPVLQAGMTQFVEDRMAQLAATAGAKMERFVQAREEEKQALLKKVRGLAVSTFEGWALLAFVGILIIWKTVICGAIDGDSTIEEGLLSNTSNASTLSTQSLQTDTDQQSSCVEAALIAYQFMRIFMSVGPALFAISEFDVDNAAVNNPWKARLGAIGVHAIMCLLGWMQKGKHWWRISWPCLPSASLIVYILVWGGPCVRQEGRHPRISTVVLAAFLVLLTFYTTMAFNSTPLMSTWAFEPSSRANHPFAPLDQPLAIEWPRQGLLWVATAYGGFAMFYMPWRTRVRQRERNHAIALMKGILQCMVISGQIGGLIGTCLLLGDFPRGELQGQTFSSQGNTAWQAIWGQGILLGFGPCFWALVFRRQVFTLLQTRFESKQRLNDGAFIATLLEEENTAPSELMDKSTALLRRIQFTNLSEELLSTSGGSAETYALSEPCALGAIDFFISHSWSDDAALKYAKLVEVNRDFEEAHGRPATFWLDKVCIDQDNIQDALRCLPVFEMASEKLLVMCGNTYVTRLWCVWELYTFFAIRSDMDRMKIEFLSEEDNVDALASFDVANAHCFSPDDEARLRNVIEAGGAEKFNKLIQDCGIKMGALKQDHELRKSMAEQRKKSKGKIRKKNGKQSASTSFANPMHTIAATNE